MGKTRQAADGGKAAGGTVQVTAIKRQAPVPTHGMRCRKDGGRRCTPGEHAAGAGADTRQVTVEKRQAAKCR
jgi:hypothetical protein